MTTVHWHWKMTLKKSASHRHQCGDYQREREIGEVEEGKGGQEGMEGDLPLGGEHTICRWCIIELYTWNPYNFISQCHPNKFNKNIFFLNIREFRFWELAHHFPGLVPCQLIDLISSLLNSMVSAWLCWMLSGWTPLFGNITNMSPSTESKPGLPKLEHHVLLPNSLPGN